MSENNFEVQPISVDAEKSVARVMLQGIGPAVENFGSDTTYRVLEGRGVFRMLKRDTLELVVIPVEAGSEVHVPRGTIYADMGNMVMEATCVPPFDPDKVRIVQDIV